MPITRRGFLAALAALAAAPKAGLRRLLAPAPVWHHLAVVVKPAQPPGPDAYEVDIYCPRRYCHSGGFEDYVLTHRFLDDGVVRFPPS